MSDWRGDGEDKEVVTHVGALEQFIAEFTALVDADPSEPDLLADGGSLLADLIVDPSWLPDLFRHGAAEAYRQYLLYCDPADRFCVVCFLWSPGQGTPVHDHGVWGLVGVMEGSEISQPFEVTEGGLRANAPPERLEAGCVAKISPAAGDIHSVRNALDDEPSISIHIYGANIGRLARRTFAPDGTCRSFISGYANAQLGEPWNQVAGL